MYTSPKGQVYTKRESEYEIAPQTLVNTSPVSVLPASGSVRGPTAPIGVLPSPKGPFYRPSSPSRPRRTSGTDVLETDTYRVKLQGSYGTRYETRTRPLLVREYTSSGYVEKRIRYAGSGEKQYVSEQTEYTNEGIPVTKTTTDYWTSKKGFRPSSQRTITYDQSGAQANAITYNNLLGTVRKTTYETFGETPQSQTVTTRTPEKDAARIAFIKGNEAGLTPEQVRPGSLIMGKRDRAQEAKLEQDYTKAYYGRQYQKQVQAIETTYGIKAQGADPELFGMLGQAQQREFSGWEREQARNPENVMTRFDTTTGMATTVNRVNEDLISRGNFLRTTGEVEARNDIGVWMGLRSRTTTISPSDTRSPDYSGGMDVSQGTVYPTPKGDWLYRVEDLAGSIKVNQIRSDGTFTKMWFGAQQFGLGALQGIAYPFVHPIDAVKGTWEFIKSPVTTAEAIGAQAVIYPEYTAGHFIGPAFLFKGIKSTRPVGRIASYVERGKKGFVPIEKTNINFVESFTSPIQEGKYVEFAGKEVTTIHITQADFKFTDGRALVRASEPGQAGKFRTERGLFEFYSSSPDIRTGQPRAYLGYTDIAPGVQESGKIRLSVFSPKVTAIIERGVSVAKPTASERAIVNNPSAATYRRLLAQRVVSRITNPQLALENLAKQSTEGQFVTTPVTTQLTLKGSTFTQYPQKVPVPAFVEQIGLGKAWEKSFLGTYPRKVVLLDVERGPAPLAVVDGGNVRFGFGPNMKGITYAEMASSLRSRYVTPAKAASLAASVAYPSQGVLSYSSPSFSSQMVGSLRVSSGSSRASGFSIAYPSIGSLRISSSRSVPSSFMSTPPVPPSVSYKYSPSTRVPRIYVPPYTPPISPPYSPPYSPPRSPPRSPPYSPPYIPPRSPPIRRFKMDSDYKIKMPRRMPTLRRYKYQPSLVAGAFNIRAPKRFRKKRLTGVEVRPFL